MFKHRSRILFLLSFIFSTVFSFAQAGLGLGYNAGCFTSPMRNMEALTYEFNRSHPNYSDKFNFINLYRGLTFTYYSNTEKGGIEIVWSNKHIISTAKGSDLPTDTVYRHEVKARQNTFSIGGYYWIRSNKINVGMDYDIFGLCRFYKKIGPDQNFRTAKWEPLFDKKGFFVTGFTFFAEAKEGRFKIRPYYQWILLPGKVPYGFTAYAFKTTNFGLAAYFTIQKKNR